MGVHPPRTLTPDEVVPVRVGREARYFEFHNDSQYHVLLRNDAAGLSPSGDFGPVDVCVPYSSKIMELVPEDEWISYVASTAYPVAAQLPGLDEPRFWFVSRKQPGIMAPSTYRGVGINESPPQEFTGTVEADVTKLINEDNAAAVAFILGQLSGDANRRVTLSTLGELAVGTGASGPARIWEVLGSGLIRFLANPRATSDPSNSQDLVRKSYADGLVAGLASQSYVDARIAVVAPALSNSHGPGHYPSVPYAMAATVANGFPAAGRIFGAGGAAENQTQLLFAAGANDLYMRSATSATSWGGWRVMATPGVTVLQPGIPPAYTVIRSVTLRRYWDGYVTVEGRVENTSGVNRAADENILTGITGTFLPATSNNQMFLVARRDAAGAWQGAGQPLYVDRSAGTVKLGNPLGAGQQVDFGNMGWGG